MPNMQTAGVQYCPDCGQQLETLWDYPSNEIWCLHCGNRFYRTLSRSGEEAAMGHRILILDAEAERRDAITGLFANSGYHVTPVCHPRQALEAASFRHFDLALLSADWPGYDTVSLIARMRRQLGDVKFVLYADPDAPLSRSTGDGDVLCVRISQSEGTDLEGTLEHLVDDLIGQPRKQVSRLRWDLAHSH